MDAKKEVRISQKKAKRNFTTIGLMLMIYVLFVMIFPYVFVEYMKLTNSSILEDKILYYGIYFIVILFGTIIPFFIMRKFARIKFRRIFRMANVGFFDVFVQTIVLFTVCIVLTYVSNVIFSRFGLDGKLIASIGFSYDEVNLSNHIYLFMLILVTPILEEYAFRGVLLTALGKYGKRFALIASSLIFAFAHNNFAEMIPACAMGFILGKIALRYRSVQPTVIIHILFNGFIYLLCILPATITKYMTYGLAAICILALYLILTGRYEWIQVQSSRSAKVTRSLFYTRFTIVLTMILMVGYTLLFTITN